MTVKSIPFSNFAYTGLHIRLLLILAMSAVVLSASAQAEIPQRYVVSGDFNYPPYEYLDENDQPAGYNVDLSRAIEKVLGVEFDIRLMKWSQARKSLETGETDLLQGMALSAERAKTLHFSIPHAQTWRSIFVAKKSRIKSIEDIVNATLVMQQGDISNEFLGMIGFKGQVVECPTQTDALRLLNQGYYDATIINHVHGMYLTKLHDFNNITVLSDQIQSRDYCYASKDVELITRINKALIHMGQTGQLRGLHDKWFAIYQPRVRPSVFLSPSNLIWVLPLFVVLLMLVWYGYHRRRKLRKINAELGSQLNASLAREAELKLEKDLFRFGPVVLYKLSIDPLRMLYISPNVDQFGYDHQDVIQMENAMFSLVHPDDLAELYTAMARLDKDNPEPSKKHYRIRNTKGSYHWVFDYSLYAKDSGGNLISYGYLLDNTLNKELEEHLIEAKLKAEEANLTKGQFLASVSHEIRNPLNGILGLISLLEEMDMTPEQREIFELIDASGRNLNGLIIDILDLSKIESGQLQKMFASFNPRFLVEDMVNTYARQRERAGVDVRLRISDDLPELVWGDHMRTRQILANLMQNALKFTSEGWVQLSAGLYARTGDTVRIQYRIQDTGIGIPVQHHEQIFELYYQGNHASKERMSGTGLGLPIVKRLVGLLGGVIWLESEPGKGSSFYVILPYSLNLTDSDDPAASDADDPEMRPLPDINILIVDSDPVGRKIIGNRLKAWGLSVDLAESGAKAIELCGTKCYRFVLMDLLISDIDGPTTTATILSHCREGQPRPFICGVSASQRPEDRERCLAAGMSEMINKPINLRSLHRILMELTNGGQGDDDV